MGLSPYTGWDGDDEDEEARARRQLAARAVGDEQGMIRYHAPNDPSRQGMPGPGALQRLTPSAAPSYPAGGLQRRPPAPAVGQPVLVRGDNAPTFAAKNGKRRTAMLMNKPILSERDIQEALGQGNVRLAYLGKRVGEAETNNIVHSILRAAQYAGHQISPEEREFIRRITDVTLPEKFDPYADYLRQDQNGRWILFRANKSQPGKTAADTGVKDGRGARPSRTRSAGDLVSYKGRVHRILTVNKDGSLTIDPNLENR